MDLSNLKKYDIYSDGWRHPLVYEIKPEGKWFKVEDVMELLKQSNTIENDAITCVTEKCCWNLKGRCGLVRICPGRNK